MVRDDKKAQQDKFQVHGSVYNVNVVSLDFWGLKRKEKTSVSEIELVNKLCRVVGLTAYLFQIATRDHLTIIRGLGTYYTQQSSVSLKTQYPNPTKTN